jgi:hypothetical protein
MSASSNDSSSILKRFNRKQDFSNEELAYREEVPTSTSSIPLLARSRMGRHFSYLRTPECRERALAYSLGLLARVLVLIVIIGVLAGLGIGLIYTGLPEEADYSDLQFNWTVNPSSYLQPYNMSFTYNILLDGHSHSTYSDGKMTVRQLLDWHIGIGLLLERMIVATIIPNCHLLCS